MHRARVGEEETTGCGTAWAIILRTGVYVSYAHLLMRLGGRLPRETSMFLHVRDACLGREILSLLRPWLPEGEISSSINGVLIPFGTALPAFRVGDDGFIGVSGMTSGALVGLVRCALTWQLVTRKTIKPSTVDVDMIRRPRVKLFGLADDNDIGHSLIVCSLQTPVVEFVDARPLCHTRRALPPDILSDLATKVRQGTLTGVSVSLVTRRISSIPATMFPH